MPSLNAVALINGLDFGLFYSFILASMFPLDIWGEAPISQSAGVMNDGSDFYFGGYSLAIIMASLLYFLVLIAESYGE